MSDLFHESLSQDEIAVVFGVMAAAPHHQFQILTKRPAEMRSFIEAVASHREHAVFAVLEMASRYLGRDSEKVRTGKFPKDWMEELAPAAEGVTWPLPNVWLGVSVEDQATADERIPLLVDTPAATRFISAEPLLGGIDLYKAGAIEHDTVGDSTPGAGETFPRPRIDWVIAGGESGPEARPCWTSWIEDIVDECRRAGLAVFVKQLGARPVDECGTTYRNPKGADPHEWPDHLLVQEFPVA